ncbi:MAG: hypothetical protein KDA85_19520, partial [Planctomycetaceae bacterium]|nr:hypothetical protein [Planctomycetaceae bacterium]
MKECLSSLSLLLSALLLTGSGRVAAQDTPSAVDFNSQIAPLLQQHCLECHGEMAQESNLRLDTFAGIAAGGKSPALVVPGSPDDSLLMIAIRYADESLQMPPEKKL